MERCRACLYPITTRPSITFDEEGICSGCRVDEKKATIDWVGRLEKLKELVEPYKGKGNYDVIIGISGGKDSHFQTYFVKEVLGLKPLLVTFNHLDNSPMGIRNLENLIVKSQCDHIRFTPNPDMVRRSIRWSIKKMSDPFWHEHAGIYTFPVQMAVKYQIPLIIWGEYGFLDLIGMFSLDDFIEMGKKTRMEHGMRGMEAEDFIKDNDEGLTLRDFGFAVYPSNDEIEKLGLRGIYIGNYIKWNSKEQTDLMIDKWDFATEKQTATFNPYENVECYFQDDFHNRFRYLKFGYGRATDHASQLIRHGIITRGEGITLVNAYDHRVSDRWDEMLKWLGMGHREVIGYIKRDRDSRVDFEPIKGGESSVPEIMKKIAYKSNHKKRKKGRVFI